MKAINAAMFCCKDESFTTAMQKGVEIANAQYVTVECGEGHAHLVTQVCSSANTLEALSKERQGNSQQWEKAWGRPIHEESLCCSECHFKDVLFVHWPHDQPPKLCRYLHARISGNTS